MPISLNTNTLALRAEHNLDITSSSFQQAVQRLSSGLRVSSAADDPSAMGISQKLIAQINGFDQAQRNAQDGLALLQTASSGLTGTMADLQRINQLAIQASNSTLTSSDRQNIQLEIQGLIQDIDRIAQLTSFNGQTLLNGSAGGAVVAGGGPNITNVQAQAGVVLTGTTVRLNTVNTQATKAAIQARQAPAQGTFTGGGSITITGPTGLSSTFVSTAGESVSNFISQVNNAGIGVTASGGGATPILLTSNDYGTNIGSNTTLGAQRITATGSATDVDFGTGAGAQLELIVNGGSGTAGSASAGHVNATGVFTDSTTANTDAVNAQITVLVNGTTSVGPITLTGLNSDQFAGTGVASGVSFRVLNPGGIGTGDTISVKQFSPLGIQVGPNKGQALSFSIDSQTSMALGVNALDLTTQSGAQAAISTSQAAITQLSAVQANLGALQNVLTNLDNLAGAQEMDARRANSNLVDADIGQEAVNFTRAQILMQAGTAMLAQANQSSVGLLALFNRPLQ